MFPADKLVGAIIGGLFGTLGIWREYVVEQTIPTMLQFGALGALIIVLMLIYKLASQWMDYKIHQKSPELPQRANGELTYNDQMARTIYDSQKTMSELVVVNKQLAESVKKNSEVQEKQLVVQEKNNLLIDRLVRALNQNYNLGVSSDGGN